MSRSTENGTDGRIGKAIAHAVAAGGLRLGAREYPEARRGLLKAAELHSARCSALISEFAGATAKVGFAIAPIMRDRRGNA